MIFDFSIFHPPPLEVLELVKHLPETYYSSQADLSQLVSGLCNYQPESTASTGGLSPKCWG